MTHYGGRLIVAGSPDDASADESGFMEAPRPDGPWATFSSALTAADCAAIDREAYEMARTWYRLPSGDDLTEVDGVSLGQAFELRATAILVRTLRARLVLDRLRSHGPISAIELRGVGPEWALAAEALGMTFEGVRSPDLSGGIPDPGAVQPARSSRTLGRLVRIVRPVRDPMVSLIGSPRWSDPYRSSIADRWPLRLVEPGRRALVDALRGRPSASPEWISDSWASEGLPSMPATEPADGLVSRSLRPSFDRVSPILASAAAAGKRLGGRLAVSTQDVSPTVRAFLLGFRRAGGDILTLEHGLSGGYDHQIHSIARILGAWGPVQAAYHRAVGPVGLRVEEIGWPRLESVFGQRPPASDVDVAYFGQPSVPLSAGGWPEDAIRADELIDGYARRHLARRVHAKPHPATRAYMGWSPRFVSTKVVGGDSLRLAAQARVVVTRRSTTALEAMAIGRPVVLIDPVGVIGSWDFLAGVDGLPHANDGASLAEAVERLLSVPPAAAAAAEAGRAFVQSFIRAVDRPGSAQRVLVDLVSSMLDEAG